MSLRQGTVADVDLTSGADGRPVDALAVPVAPAVDGEHDLQPRGGTADAAARYGIDLADLAERAGLSGRAGSSYTVHLPRRLVAVGAELPWAGLPERLVLVGVGQGDSADLRKAGAALARATRGLGRVVTSIGGEGHPDEVERVRSFVEGYLLGSYRPPSAATSATDDLTGEADPPRLDVLGLADSAQAHVLRAALDAAETACRATWLARDLTNVPASTKNPAWFAERAERLAADAGLRVEVKDARALAAEGFGGLLAVGSASATPPRLVTVRYTPAGDRRAHGRHVVVVGKGITFDTGGLSIKARPAMVPMKTDMAGAAVALAVVLAAARAELDDAVTAVLPLAENHVGAASYRPGDVLTCYGGQTVEVANTDAEGRLVLADALAWAGATLQPDVLVDVATLTGAATVGLGQGHAAMFTGDDALSEQLVTAAERTGERVWRMPLVEDYLPALRSEIADLRHVPIDPPGAGAITAALFLRSFTPAGVPWAHLDIAGPARSGKDAHEVSEGATGFGARLLVRWLERR